MQKPGGADRWDGPYLKKDLPPDPWGKPYIYKSPGIMALTNYFLWR